jgi:molybdate transport system substrate-binding protein
VETLNVLSAGAAQAVVERAAEEFRRDHASRCATIFGGVHAMRLRLLAGEAADVVILTDELIDDLIARQLVVAGSRVDLGTVSTGVAVRTGTWMPDVRDTLALRETLLAARAIVAPDPQFATAGRVLQAALQSLGIEERVGPQLVWAESGHAALKRLAAGDADNELGVAQMTEIVGSSGVCLAGALPPELQRPAIYSAGLAAASCDPERSSEFIRRLKTFSSQMQAEGFGACP